MTTMNRDAPRGLAARWASGDRLSEGEAAVLIEAVALDLQRRFENAGESDRPRWNRWDTIATLARCAALMATATPPPNMRIRQGGKVPRPNLHQSPEEPTSWWRRLVFGLGRGRA